MHKFKSAVAAQLVSLALIGAVIATLAGTVAAQDATDIDQLMQDLATAEEGPQADRLERRVISEWSKSGSPAMDLLLKRGRDAIAVDDMDAALDHLTALTDHAPDFAEGWHALALAYFRTEKLGPATEALERTLALNPRHFGALRGMGAILEQVGKPALAYQAYSKVLSLRPHDSTVSDALERLAADVTGTAL